MLRGGTLSSVNYLNLIPGIIPIVFARPFAATTYRYYQRIGFDALSQRALVYCFRGIGLILVGSEVYSAMK